MLDPGGAPWRRRFDGWTGSRRPSARSPRSSRAVRAAGTRTRRSRTSRSATRRRCRCPGYVDALQRALTPAGQGLVRLQDERAERRSAAVARSLTARTGLDWDPADVAMTNGGFAAIAVTLRAIVEPGDEVDLPVAAVVLLRAADPGRGRRAGPGPARRRRRSTSTSRRSRPRSPRGPGRSWSTRRTTRPAGSTRSSRSAALGDVLDAGVRRPRPADPSDQRRAVQPDRLRRARRSTARPRSTRTRSSTYSYGKTLLAPGHAHRLPHRARRRCPTARRSGEAIFVAQIATGYAFPNALLQHAIEDLEQLSIDIGALERRRDRLVPALRDAGLRDDDARGHVLRHGPLADRRRRGLRATSWPTHGALVLPGTVVEVPGWFRISLTASDAMVERGLRSFASAIEAVPTSLDTRPRRGRASPYR